MDFIFLTPQQIEEARVRHQMLQADSANRVRRLFEEQTPENLATLGALLAQCGNDKRMGAHYAGYAEAMFLNLHPNRCKDCGEDHAGVEHEKSVAPVGADEKREVEAEPEAFNGVPERWSQPTFEDIVSDADTPAIDIEEAALENFRNNLREYNVELEDPERPLGAVICNGCRQWYVSLSDRMLREPGVEGCGGCMHKEKWG